MNFDRRLGLLGLLYVAHKALIGEELVASLSRCKLLIVASDAKSGQAAALRDKAKSRHLPLIDKYQAEELGRALGKDAVTAVGITDEKAAISFLGKGVITGGARK